MSSRIDIGCSKSTYLYARNSSVSYAGFIIKSRSFSTVSVLDKLDKSNENNNIDNNNGNIVVVGGAIVVVLTMLLIYHFLI
jgi:hypothetical protein